MKKNKLAITMIASILSVGGLSYYYLYQNSKKDEENLTRIIELNDNNFENYTQSGNWVIRIYNPTCSICNEIKSYFPVLAEKYQDVNFGQLNINKNPKLDETFNLGFHPSFLFLKDKKEIYRLGYSTMNELEEIMDKTFYSSFTGENL